MDGREERRTYRRVKLAFYHRPKISVHLFIDYKPHLFLDLTTVVFHQNLTILMCYNCSVSQILTILWNSCGTIFQIRSRVQTPSLCLRVGLKLSFLIKLIVRADQAHLGSALSYAAIGLDYWGTSHDALNSSLFLPLTICTHSCPINACY